MGEKFGGVGASYCRQSFGGGAVGRELACTVVPIPLFSFDRPFARESRAEAPFGTSHASKVLPRGGESYDEEAGEEDGRGGFEVSEEANDFQDGQGGVQLVHFPWQIRGHLPIISGDFFYPVASVPKFCLFLLQICLSTYT